MRIDRLIVKNFRCFEEREFSFHPQFNCLTGENGSGKTAILEAVAIAAGSWLLGIKGYGERTIASNDIRIVPRKYDTVLSFERQLKPPPEVTAFGQVMENSGTWSRKSTVKGYTTQTEARWIKKIAEQADTDVRLGKNVTLPVLVYYGADRLDSQYNTKARLKSIEQDELSRLEGYRDSIGDSRVNSSLLIKWLEYQDRITYQEGGRETLSYRLVREAIIAATDSFTQMEFSAKRSEPIIHLKDGNMIPFIYLSTGQKLLVTTVGDIAMRMMRLNPHLSKMALLETPGIVIIDELDLFLHPEWQRSIVGNLKKIFPKVQFFVTTHSPFIIQALGEGEHFPLDGQPVPTPGKMGIEDIAEGLMGVKRADAGRDYVDKVEAAKDYLRLLDEAELAPEEKLEEYKRLLAEHLVPHADNPAYQALLELERVARIGA